MNDRDLINVSKRAVQDFKSGIATPWRLVSTVERLIDRIEELEND